MILLQNRGQAAGYFSLGRVADSSSPGVLGCSLFLWDLDGSDRELFLTGEHASRLCRWFDGHQRDADALSGCLVLESTEYSEESVILFYRVDGDGPHEPEWLLLYNDSALDSASQFGKVLLDTNSMHLIVSHIASSFKVDISDNR